MFRRFFACLPRIPRPKPESLSSLLAFISQFGIAMVGLGVVIQTTSVMMIDANGIDGQDALSQMTLLREGFNILTTFFFSIAVLSGIEIGHNQRAAVADYDAGFDNHAPLAVAGLSWALIIGGAFAPSFTPLARAWSSATGAAEPVQQLVLNNMNLYGWALPPICIFAVLAQMTLPRGATATASAMLGQSAVNLAVTALCIYGVNQPQTGISIAMLAGSMASLIGFPIYLVNNRAYHWFVKRLISPASWRALCRPHSAARAHFWQIPKIGLPIVLMGLANAANNWVGGWRASQLGAGANRIYGLVLLYTGFAAGIGGTVADGASVISSVALGERSITRLNAALRNALAAGSLVGLGVFALVETASLVHFGVNPETMSTETLPLIAIAVGAMAVNAVGAAASGAMRGMDAALASGMISTVIQGGVGPTLVYFLSKGNGLRGICWANLMTAVLNASALWGATVLRRRQLDDSWETLRPLVPAFRAGHPLPYSAMAEGLDSPLTPNEGAAQLNIPPRFSNTPGSTASSVQSGPPDAMGYNALRYALADQSRRALGQCSDTPGSAASGGAQGSVVPNGGDSPRRPMSAWKGGPLGSLLGVKVRP